MLVCFVVVGEHWK